MDAINQFFIDYGYLGMALVAFLSGTVLPISSEAVMATMLAASGMDPVLTVASGTVGNVLASVVNYFVGSLTKPETMCKWFRIKEKRMRTAQRYVGRFGAWAGFISFIPVLGIAISLVLGMCKANFFWTFVTTFTGKFLRYVIVAYSVMAFK